MDCITLTNEQFSELLDVLVVDMIATTFMTVLFAFIAWDAINYLLKKLIVIIRVRCIKRLRNQTRT
ncbi:hypothetical protein [uncultured Photobacterium sp.]|uniref:hypothetical protein n=1 Tax=uncultured Photobacterium sp. TaxID=173973 RepID=UPI002616DD52|nr:hypothetical protein [uncultured Photobacterium sp.]